MVRSVLLVATMHPKWRAMARVGLHMMVHDQLKMLATLAGVVFAVVLANQGLGTFLGLLQKNTMFVDNAGADLWILPPATRSLQGGKTLPDADVMTARTTPGVAWAEPILFGTATVSLPAGGSEAVTLLGAKYPDYRGGPWNMVRGDARVLSEPDTIVFEDYDREKLGDLNLGDTREVNGRKLTAAGFTWGLMPFGPSYAFADFDTARMVLHTDADRVSFVLVAVAPGEDVEAVRAELRRRVPEAQVMTKAELSRSIVAYVLETTSIGVTIGSTTAISIVVGFFIVALSMFSSVVDHLREFGTLKAIGATTANLAVLLFSQAAAFAGVGTLIGLAVISRVAAAIRSPTMTMILPPEGFAATAIAMFVLCMLASSLSLLRLRKLEPAMVFR